MRAAATLVLMAACARWDMPEAPLWTVDVDGPAGAIWGTSVHGTTAIVAAKGAPATIRGRTCATPCIATIDADGALINLMHVEEDGYPQGIGVDAAGDVTIVWGQKRIVRYDAQSLAVQWTRDDTVYGFTTGESGEVAYHQVLSNGALILLGADGAKRWETTLYASPVEITSAGDVLARVDLTFLLLDGATGGVIDSYPHDMEGAALVTERDGALAVVGESGGISKLDGRDEILWSRPDLPVSNSEGFGVQLTANGDVLVSGVAPATIDPRYGVRPGFPAMALLDGDSGALSNLVERSSSGTYSAPDATGYVTSSDREGFGVNVYDGIVKHAVPERR